MFSYKLTSDSKSEIVDSLLNMPLTPEWSYVNWAVGLIEKKSFFLHGVEFKLINGYVSLHSSHAQANFLTFRINNDSLYTIVQRLGCVWAVIEHDHNTAYVKEYPSGNRKRSFESFYKKISSKNVTFSTPGFGGVLFSNHSRPYHQIYDCMPSFLEMSEKGLMCLVNKDVSFLPTSMIGDDVKLVSSADIKKADNIFFVFPCIDRGLSLEKAVEVSLDNFFVNKKVSFKGSPIIWLGLGGLKRTLVGLEDFLHEFIKNASKEFGKCLYIFDGLTSPVGGSESSLKDYNSKERELVSRVISNTGIQESSVLLFGEKAETKLEWASIADFFVTNALTDSMWCSLFYRLPGVVHYSPASLSEVRRTQRHYKSYFVPAHLMTNMKKKGETVSWADYSIDPRLLSEISLAGLRSALFLKKYRLRVENKPSVAFREVITLEKGEEVLFEPPASVSSELNSCFIGVDDFEICFDVETVEGNGVFLVKNEFGHALKRSDERVFFLTLENAPKELVFSYTALENCKIRFFGVRVQAVIA